jgi:tetratricopeptide (TPR) repeat protein
VNDQFSCYLTNTCSPEYLEETMEYKFAIAEQFRCGAKRRIFGYKRLPKWASGKRDALTIYDEITCALPCHDLAAQSFYSKGLLLSETKDFRCSVEAFQTLIRRFPMHELAPEAYLASLSVYLGQACCEYQNPDVLALAEIILRRFADDFPNEERLCEGEALFAEMKEVFAYGLYETGSFYERTCHPQASVLYYSSAIQQFPDTCVADKARQRLASLLACNPCLTVPQRMCDVEEDVCHGESLL